MLWSVIRLLLAASVGALGASVALALLGFDQVPTEEGLPAALFDVSTLDLTPVQLLVDQTPALTGIDLAAADVMVLVRRATNAAVTTPTEFAVSVDGDYHDAWITADATGAVVAMEGGAPGSPAALAAQANG